MITAAPQTPNSSSGYPNGLTANGAFVAYPSTVSALSTLNTSPSSAMVSTFGTSVCDYFFLQIYNQGFYIGDQSFYQNLAQWGYLCMMASPRRCKIIIGVASSDGSPIWDPNSPSSGTAALASAINAATQIIDDQMEAPVVESDWLAGVGAWISPAAVPALTQMYSSSGVPNLPTTVAMTYSNPSGFSNNWIPGTNVPIKL